ncbi:alpha/beta hydrolase fold protein [Vibrio sinaloensis DSM 21326]|uniref:Alpha/beta hydrolase fold protein n=1 Tax=Vibrio sinaloensis DSM 21326 TaxID=945550 RepID=E8MC74_PHOS4|nr:alpha/beta hydrolase [Vibrio sinaloensis]EGA68379.1 alpha/beta hydrolase fold protein [Vibrio sinaloensis DSM 21326]
MGEERQQRSYSFEVDGEQVALSAVTRDGDKEPILFLHGFGSTKEDYTGIVNFPRFDGHPFLAYDAPGFGQSRCQNLHKVDITFLVKTALKVLELVKFERFHLVGHSMGGLTALMLAQLIPERVLSFTDIEGNIAPEDCFLSRQIVEYDRESDEQFFTDFIQRTSQSADYASALYAASLPHKVQLDVVRSVFSSMVELSDHGQLMACFLGLPMPKMFMFGEQNDHLSYLEHIESHGVTLAKIPYCGHFPMYSNPVAMWQKIGENISAA